MQSRDELVVKTVPFCGAGLLAVQDKETGKIYAGINSILRELGFDEKQIEYRRDKWTSDKAISKGTRKFSGTLIGAGTGKDVWCIDVKKLPLALAKLEITPKMEKDMPDLSEKLEKYQDECADILAEAFVEKKRPLSAIEQIRLQNEALLEVNEKVDNVQERVDNLENTMNIDYAQQKQLKDFANEVVVNALGGKESKAYHYRYEDGSKLSAQVFARFWRDFKDYFNINAYANLPRVRFDEALQYINRWQPPTNMQLEIWRINRTEEVAC